MQVNRYACREEIDEEKLLGGTDERNFHSFCMSDDGFSFFQINNTSGMYDCQHTHEPRLSYTVLWLKHLDLIFFFFVFCGFHSMIFGVQMFE